MTIATIESNSSFSFPLLGVLTGFLLFVALFFIDIGKDKRSEPEFLLFGLICLAMTGFSYVGQFLYQAQTVVEVVAAWRWRMSCGLIVLVMLAAFIGLYTRDPKLSSRLWWIGGISLFFLAINLISPFTVFFSMVQGPPLAVILPWGERINRFFVTPSIWVPPIVLFISSCLIWMCRRSVVLYLKGERTAIEIAVSLVLLLCAFIYNNVANILNWDFPFVFEYAYLGLVACMGSAPVRELRERRREAEKAAVELRIAAKAFEIEDGMMITDEKATIIRVNRSFTKLTGYSAEEVVGKLPNLLNSGRQNSDFHRIMRDALASDKYWQGEIWYRHKNGEVRPGWFTITAVCGADGKALNYVGCFADISERMEARAQIQNLAFYDTLTHLPNRRLLMDRIAKRLAPGRRHNCYGALLFIDLDDFKTINNAKGHLIGDQLLIDVAARLESCARDADTISRIGGDEFVVMFENLSTDVEQAAAQAEHAAGKILSAINQPCDLQGHRYHGTGCIGISLFRSHEATVDDLIKRADTAMYKAK